jgi:D-glycerate 3-kinase
VFEGPAAILILEGWCLGARPQASEALDAPINALERDSDPDGSWRLYVNGQLAGPYRRLFDRIDLRVLLAVPDFDTVAGWRIEQEQTLRAQCLAEGRTAGKLMTDAEVRRFVAYFQRITEQMLRDAASIADLVIPLDAHRRLLAS